MPAFGGFFPLDMKREARQGEVVKDVDFQVNIVCN